MKANEFVTENLRNWFKEKWVRFGPDGKIRGDCARGDDNEGKPKCLPQSKAHSLGKKGRASAAARKRREDPNPERSGKAINVNTKKKSNEGVAEEQLDEKCWDTHKQVGMKNKGGRQVPNCVPKESIEESRESCPECGGPMFSDLLLAEKQDACYNKVKSRYKVWPSAYASGALVQCRKKGAANWGNSGKKNESIEEDQLDEKWTKKYKDSINCSNPKGFSQRAHCAGKQKNEDTTMNQNMSEDTNELYRVLQLSGLDLTEDLNADQQFDIIEEMVEQLAQQHGVDAEQIWEDFESVDDNELYETAAWRRKEGKSKSGGLNAKGVASYRRENPGSKLQTAVTTKPSKLKPGSKAAKRRKSFCARMSGVKGPMKKPNGKPTRKALALRKWNC